MDAPPPRADSRAPENRISSIDAIKALGILAVICIHANPAVRNAPSAWQIAVQLTRFAVPFFFIAAGYFFTVSSRQTPPQKILRKTFWRIGAAFFCWALFYAVVPPYVSGESGPFLKAALEHLRTDIGHPIAFLLSGGVYHLWFLSSLLQALIIIGICAWLGRPHWALWAGALLFLAGLAAGSYSDSPLGIHTRFNSMRGPFFSAFPVALGAWMARANIRCSPRSALILALAGLTLHFLEATLLKHYFGTPFLSHSYLLGTMPWAAGVFLFALAQPDFGTSFGWNRLGKYSLGLYAFHVYILELLRQGPFPFLQNQPFLVLLITFVVVSLLVPAMGQLRRLQFLLK